MMRLASYRICQHLVGDKVVSIETFWPIGDEKQEVKIEPMTKEKFDYIVKKHGLKLKNARGN